MITILRNQLLTVQNDLTMERQRRQGQESTMTRGYKGGYPVIFVNICKIMVKYEKKWSQLDVNIALNTNS